jgi:HK97 family phage major capsid protein
MVDKIAELDLTDEQVKGLMALASKMLDAEKKGEQTPAGEAGLERKNPTGVAAIDQGQAVNRDEGTTFGKGVLIQPKKARTLKEFSIAAAIKGVAGMGWKGADLEKEWVQKATLELNDDSAGGFLVPDETFMEIMPKLRAKAVFRAAGATPLPDSPPVQNLPTQTGSTTGYWIGMGAQTAVITKSEPTFGNKQLVLKRHGTNSRIDKALLRHSAFAVENIVRKDVVKTLALGEDQKFWNGSGGTEPRGILYDPSLTNTYSTIGAVSIFTHIKGALDTLSARDAGDNITGMVMHPTTYGYLTSKVDGVDRAYLWPDMSKGYQTQIAGYPVYMSTQITNGYVLIGDFSEFFIADGAGIMITVQTETYAEYDQIGLVAIHEVDGLARQIASFEILSGITS